MKGKKATVPYKMFALHCITLQFQVIETIFVKLGNIFGLLLTNLNVYILSVNNRLLLARSLQHCWLSHFSWFDRCRVCFHFERSIDRKSYA